MSSIGDKTKNQYEYKTYHLNVKKGFLGRITVTFKDPSHPETNPTAQEKKIATAVKRTIGPLLPRKLEMNCTVIRDGQASFHIEDDQHCAIAQITIGSCSISKKPVQLAPLLKKSQFCTTSPISAVDAFSLSLPDRKQTPAQIKKDLSRIALNSKKVNAEHLRSELRQAQDLRNVFSDFGLQRLQSLLQRSKPLTHEEEKFIRESYAKYIEKGGLYLGSSFFHIVTIAYPKLSVFINSKEEIHQFSLDPGKAIASSSVFLYKEPGVPGYHCYTRTDDLNTKQPIAPPTRSCLTVLNGREYREKHPVSIWTALKTELGITDAKLPTVYKKIAESLKHNPQELKEIQQELADLNHQDTASLQKILRSFCQKEKISFSDLKKLFEKSNPSPKEKALIRQAYLHYIHTTFTDSKAPSLGGPFMRALHHAFPDHPIVIQGSDGHIQCYLSKIEAFPAANAIFLKEDRSGSGYYTFDPSPTEKLPDLKNPSIYLTSRS